MRKLGYIVMMILDFIIYGVGIFVLCSLLLAALNPSSCITFNHTVLGGFQTQGCSE